jgi:hypothetical protein
MTARIGIGTDRDTDFSTKTADGTNVAITSESIVTGDKEKEKLTMETTRRSVLSKALGAGAVASVAVFSGLWGTPRFAAADADEHERREERRYPKIHNALEALRSARAELHHAGEDFHGHKDDAMRAVDAAIRQLEAVVEEHPH